MKPRVRFAPSPTGPIHVGNARTALFNWLYARRTGGTFILRIEDTDTERRQEGAEEAILEDLRWLGLHWDEGPVPDLPAASAARESGGGPHGPYRQSERGRFYEEAFSRLRSKGALYPCFCSEEVLEEDRRVALVHGRTPGYIGRCAGISEESAERRIAAGEPFVLRFRVRQYGIVSDLARGEIDFRSREVFDPVVQRRDGRPTYNFAAVVDDALMEITHVLRGEDHLTNTALQLRLYEEMERRPPLFAHLPLILGPDGTPLAKRHGASSVSDFRRRGYPAEALVNSLSLLGWTPPDDRVLLSRDEMVALFDLSRVASTAAIFDGSKLDWISSQVIRSMDRNERARSVGESLRAAGFLEGACGPASALLDWLTELGDLLATSIERFEQVPDRAAFVFTFDPDAALAAGAMEGEGARSALEAFASLFETTGEPLDASAFASMIEEAKRRTGLRGRALLHPLRAAVTGRESGPELARALPLIARGSRLALTPPVPGLTKRIRHVLERGAGPAATGA